MCIFFTFACCRVDSFKFGASKAFERYTEEKLVFRFLNVSFCLTAEVLNEKDWIGWADLASSSIIAAALAIIPSRPHEVLIVTDFIMHDLFECFNFFNKELKQQAKCNVRAYFLAERYKFTESMFAGAFVVATTPKRLFDLDAAGIVKLSKFSTVVGVVKISILFVL